MQYGTQLRHATRQRYVNRRSQRSLPKREEPTEVVRGTMSSGHGRGSHPRSERHASEGESYTYNPPEGKKCSQSSQRREPGPGQPSMSFLDASMKTREPVLPVAHTLAAPCSRSHPGPGRPLYLSPRDGSSLQGARGRLKEGHSGCGPSTRLLGAARFTMDGRRQGGDFVEAAACPGNRPYTRTGCEACRGCHAPGRTTVCIRDVAPAARFRPRS